MVGSCKQGNKTLGSLKHAGNFLANGIITVLVHEVECISCSQSVNQFVNINTYSGGFLQPTG